MDKVEPFIEVGDYGENYWVSERFSKITKIPFTVNRLGYRCKHVLPPSTDYILVAGCSHTFGQSLKNEERYVTLLENHFQIPVLNIGVRNGAPNLIRDNLLQLLSSGYTLPKYIIIQWPNENRLWMDTWGINAYVTGKQFKRFFEGDCLKNISQRSYNHVQWLLKSANIPSFQFKIWSSSNDIDMPYIDIVDYAADRSHPGTISNQNIAKLIIKNMKEYAFERII